MQSIGHTLTHLCIFPFSAPEPFQPHMYKVQHCFTSEPRRLKKPPLKTHTEKHPLSHVVLQMTHRYKVSFVPQFTHAQEYVHFQLKQNY